MEFWRPKLVCLEKFSQSWGAKSSGSICKLHLSMSFTEQKDEKKLDYSTGYRIYLIKSPRRLLNSWTLRVGVYVRWVLIRGWALIKISASVLCLFCHKTINGNNKMQRCNKARFLSNNQKKTLSLGSLLLVLIQFFGGWEQEGGGVSVGAYLSLSGRRRGWVLINFFCL